MAKKRKAQKPHECVEARILESAVGIFGCWFIFQANTFVELVGTALLTALMIWLSRDLGGYVHHLREEQKRITAQQQREKRRKLLEARKRAAEELAYATEELAEQQRREELRKARESQFQQRRQAKVIHSIQAARQISSRTATAEIANRAWGSSDDDAAPSAP